MSIGKVTGFKEEDLAVLNKFLDELDRRLSKIDNVTPTAEVDETKFSHKIPIVIAGSTYYIMLTAS
jgi:hypothetical protein